MEQPPFVDIPISSATNQSTEHFLFLPSVRVECIYMTNKIHEILYLKNIKYNKKSLSTLFGECCISCSKVVRTRQYINLLDKSWITRHTTWYHRLSRIFFIKHAILANKIGSVLVKKKCILKKSGDVLTRFPQIRPRLERNDFTCTSIWQEAEWRWMGVEWWGWGERTGGTPNGETHIFSSPCQRQCELLPSPGVRRLSSVNFTHFNLLLCNTSAKWSETW